MRFFTIVLALGFLPLGAAAGQSVIRMESMCEACRITWTRVSAIGGDNGTLSGYPPSVLRLADGSIVLIDQVERIPFLFDASGGFVRRLGRKGAGPGEFMYARLVIDGGHRGVEVLDPRLNRRTIIGADSSIVTIPFPGNGPTLGSAVRTPGGGLIANRVLLDATGAGVPLHEYDSSGMIVAHFGQSTVFAATESWRMMREMFYSGEGTLLVLNPYSHEIEEFRADRTLVAKHEREAPWLPPLAPNTEPSGGHGQRVPSTIGKAIWRDSSGVTWVATLVPAPGWKPVPEGASPAAPQYRFHTVIEAIDMRARRLVAVDTMPSMASGLAGPGHLATYGEREDGTPYVEVWRVVLETPR